MRQCVAVVGPAEPEDPAVLTAAREVGAGLAAASCTVVTGGLGGVMAAASEGAHDAGGFVVGILPGTDPGIANEHVDLAVPTGLGEGRNLVIVRMVQVGRSSGRHATPTSSRWAMPPARCKPP